MKRFLFDTSYKCKDQMHFHSSNLVGHQHWFYTDYRPPSCITSSKHGLPSNFPQALPPLLHRSLVEHNFRVTEKSWHHHIWMSFPLALLGDKKKFNWEQETLAHLRAFMAPTDLFIYFNKVVSEGNGKENGGAKRDVNYLIKSKTETYWSFIRDQRAEMFTTSKYNELTLT